jgi:serine/threonine-protein kinase
MGAVYEAVQEDLGRAVAVKVLHAHLAQMPDLVERFRREAQAAGALGHPHIVQVTDFHPGDPPFLVMERLVGSSLKQVLKKSGPLPLERVAHIFTQVLSALSAAHAAQIVHRDIKPDNIFLSSSSAVDDMVTVLDFGIAKLLDEPDVTNTGALLGTLSYMAPEQARGGTIDRRTDLYAVASCMYHAITGRRPFEGAGNADLITAIVLNEPPAMVSLRPEVDTALVSIVQRGLAKAPQERFQSADEMATALEAWLGGARSAPKTVPMPVVQERPPAPPVPAPAPAGPALAPVAPAPTAFRAPSFEPSHTLVSARASEGSASSALVIGGIVVGGVLALGAMVAVIAFALMARSPASATMEIDAGGSPLAPVVTATAAKTATASAPTILRPIPASTARATSAKSAAIADASVPEASVRDASVAPVATLAPLPTDAAPAAPVANDR